VIVYVCFTIFMLHFFWSGRNTGVISVYHEQEFYFFLRPGVFMVFFIILCALCNHLARTNISLSHFIFCIWCKY